MTSETLARATDPASGVETRDRGRRRLRSVGRLFTARAAGAAAQFGTNALLGNLLGAEGLGRYFLYVAWSNVACTLGGLGLPEATLRTVSTQEPPHGAASRRFVGKALSLALLSGGALALALWLAAPRVARVVLGDPTAWFVVAFAGMSAVLLLRTRIQTAALKAADRRETAIALETTAQPVLVGLAAGAIVWAGPRLGAEGAVRLHLLAALVVMLGAHALWSHAAKRRESFESGVTAPRLVARQLLPLWGSSLLTVSLANLPFLVLPHVAPAAEIGRFGVAWRVVALATIILQALSSWFAPRFARAHARGDRAALARQLRASQLYALGSYVPFLLLFVLVPTLVLGIFGPEFVEARGLLLVLALGQAVNAATGLVGYFLIMVGRERTVFAIQLCGFLGATVAMLALGSTHAAYGVAWAQAVSLALVNLALLAAARRALRAEAPASVA